MDALHPPLVFRAPRVADGRVADGRVADGRVADGRVADGTSVPVSVNDPVTEDTLIYSRQVNFVRFSFKTAI